MHCVPGLGLPPSPSPDHPPCVPCSLRTLQLAYPAASTHTRVRVRHRATLLEDEAFKGPRLPRREIPICPAAITPSRWAEPKTRGRSCVPCSKSQDDTGGKKILRPPAPARRRVPSSSSSSPRPPSGGLGSRRTPPGERRRGGRPLEPRHPHRCLDPKACPSSPGIFADAQTQRPPPLRPRRPPDVPRSHPDSPLRSSSSESPGGKSRRRRAYPQQIVTTRLLYCLQDPFAQLSRLQRI